VRTPKPKSSAQRGAALARGGNTPMFGRDNRTRTATADAAGTQTPAITSQKSRDNLKHAAGGTLRRGGSLASSATPSRTGPGDEVTRSSTRNYPAGGVSKPARPGQCGT